MRRSLTVPKKKTKTHTTSKESTNTATLQEPSPALLTKLGFRPVTEIQKLPEYHQAGLRESYSEKYLPSLGVNTLEELLGLIRGSTKLLAEELGTTESKLIDLYNAAVVSQLPAMSAQTMEDLLKEEFTFGLSLEAPPQAYAMSLASEPDIEMDVEASNPVPSATSVNVSLIDQHMPTIRDQGDRGTCVAFSTCAVMEYMANSAGRPNQDLSVQYLYWAVKRVDGYPQEGTWLQFSFPVAKKEGTCSNALWPYAPNVIAGNLTHGNPPNPSACEVDALANAFTRAIRIRDYRQPEAIRNQLQQGRPVAIAIPVFESWFRNPTSRLSGKIHLPLGSDRFALSGHAIVLVGYGEDAIQPGGGYFIVRNSWGGRWGSSSPFGAGYGFIPYQYIERYNADAWTGVV